MIAFVVNAWASPTLAEPDSGQPPNAASDPEPTPHAAAQMSSGFKASAKFEIGKWPSSHHPPRVNAPTQHGVRFVHPFLDGGTAFETDAGAVIDAENGSPLIAGQPGRSVCAAGVYPNVACLAEVSLFDQNNQLVAQELWLQQTGRAPILVGRVGAQGTLTALGIYVDQGDPSFLFSEYPGGEASPTTRWVSSGMVTAVQLAVTGDGLRALGSDRLGPHVRFVNFQGQPYAIYRHDDELLAKPASSLAASAPPIAISSEVKSVYEFRAVVGSDGWLYVFFHDPDTESLHVATSADGVRFDVQRLDKGETGTQVEAFADESGVHATYYYHHDQFDRGVRLVTMRNGAPARAACSLVREENHNVGWGLGLATSRGGDVWLTYFDPVEESQRRRVWSRLAPHDLQAHCEPVDLADPSNLSLNLGVGVWYDNWRLHGTSLKAEDNDGVGVGGTEYDVDPALLTTMAIEARYGNLDFGLRYAKEVLKEDLKRLERFSRFGGHFKIGNLLAGHDIRLEGAYGHYTGTMAPGANVQGVPSTFETRYADVHLYAVNTWRIKYGLAFTRYELPVPVHVYTAGQGQTQYSYEGSFVRDGAVDIASLMVGASKLDYISKYENHFNDVFIDGSAGVGVAFTSLDQPIQTSAGSVDDATDIVFRGRAMAGWLFMHRFRSAAGLGFYLRPAYLFDAFVTSAGKPSDREKQDENDALDPDTSASTGITALHHGPWFDLGLLW